MTFSITSFEAELIFPKKSAIVFSPSPPLSCQMPRRTTSPARSKVALCNICAVTHPPGAFYRRLGCEAHESYCAQCWRSYVASHSVDALDHVRCMNPSCDNTLASAEVCELLGLASYERLCSMQPHADRGVRHCPSCAAPIFRVSGCDEMHCTHCQWRFDWTATVAYHPCTSRIVVRLKQLALLPLELMSGMFTSVLTVLYVCIVGFNFAHYVYMLAILSVIWWLLLMLRGTLYTRKLVKRQARSPVL